MLPIKCGKPCERLWTAITLYTAINLRQGYKEADG